MPFRRFPIVGLSVGIAVAWTASAPRLSAEAPNGFEKSVRPVLARFCIECHGEKKQSGGLALHDQSAESIRRDPRLWVAVVERLESGEMPPKGKPQPTAEQRKAVITWLRAELARLPRGTDDQPRSTLRRLNRAEYNATIRDLFALDFQPAEDFPADDVGYGFDTIGDVLSLSPLLLEKYLAAAETVVQKAFTGDLPPLPPKREIRPREFRATHALTPAPDRGVMIAEGDVSFRHEFPKDGEYVILFRALGARIDDVPVRIALRIDGAEVHKADLRPYSGQRDLPDREITVKASAGARTVSIALVNPKSNPEAADPKKRQRAAVLGAVEIRGPLTSMNRVMPEAYRRIMIAQPGPSTSPRDAAAAILQSIARRAFRRPVTAEEIDRLVRLVEQAQNHGESFEQGIQLALQAVLASPHFLFKVERDQPEAASPYPITEHELATRLSYFLWSSCPDEELLALADRGELRGRLESQLRRMLADPRSRALAENFAGQWLQIRNLQAVAPDPHEFPRFDEALRQAMIQETLHFFDAVVRNDRPIGDFLDADYTFVNERLARHYGIPGVRGREFRRVSLQGTPRAGLLTHASILTVTSNVTRTSPVKRGKFVMENLLAAPVPPPPPEVPELSESPDARSSGSLRQRMELHRAKPECSVCHEKMDAIGFAFEHFDGIGGWRDRDGSFGIDGSGTLPDGRAFRDLAELRQLLRAQPNAFRRCLAEKLLIYALGRGLGPIDRPAIDSICDQTRRQDDRMSGLLLAIVTSEPFQTRLPSRRSAQK